MKRIIWLIIISMNIVHWSCEEEEESPPTATITNELDLVIFSEFATISVVAEAESGIERVEFYLQYEMQSSDSDDYEFIDSLVFVDYESPYEIRFNTLEWYTVIIEGNSFIPLRIVAHAKNGMSTTIEALIQVDNESSRPQSVNVLSVDYTLDSMTVTWEESPDEDFGFYRLNQRIEIGGPSGDWNEVGTIANITERSVTSYSIVDFDPNDYNWFSIEVVDTIGLESDAGESRHNDLDTDPSSVDIVDIYYDTTRMTITWEEYVPNEGRLQRLNLQNGTSILNDFHSYELYWYIEEGDEDSESYLLATIDEQTDTTFSITEFDPTRANWFYVRVRDYWGNRSDYLSATHEFPEPPTGPELFVGPTVNDSLTFYWTQDSSGSFTYTLYQSETEENIIDNAMDTWQTMDTSIMIPSPDFEGVLYFLLVIEDYWGLTGESDVEIGYYVECDTSEVALFGECYSIENTTDINLEYSDLHGIIPEEIGLLTNLVSLFLNDNQLYGNIPASIGNLVNLERLQLQSNDLSGEIPGSMGNLQSLNFLWLSGNELSGTLPVEMANMSNLETLYIRDNNLSGVIPSNICDLNISFSDYGRFRINDNYFCPPYPSCISLDAVGYQGLCDCTDIDIVEIEGQCYSSEYSTEVNLSSRGISEIPSDIYDFTNLRILRLNNNALAGAIPSQIFNLTTLRELYLNDNDFSNEIPSAVGNLTNLTRLELHHNDLSGSIPTSICNIPYLCISCYPEMNFDHNKLCPPYPYCAVDNPSLDQGHQNLCDCTDIDIVEIEGECYSTYYTTSINLSYKGLSEIPEELYAFTNLTYLNLNNNNLSGEIPEGLLSLTNLDELHLANNNFSGELPTDLFNSEIKILNLSNNDFSGTIPSQIGIMDSIVDLNLSDNNISGTIPEEVGNLTHINYLQLQGNQLSGNFPESICDVNLNVRYNRLCPPYPSCLPEDQITSQNICDCDLDYEIVQLVFNDDTLCVPQDIEDLYPDDFTSIDYVGSTIPSEIGSLVNLRHLNLAGMGLTGSIPSEIGSLINLLELDLRDNMLTGSIPPEIGNLTELRNLFFENNELSGPIPSEIGNLINIELYLNLHDNMLSGPIPASIGNLTGIRHLYFFNNELSGEIPPELSSLAICADFKLFNNQLSGEIPESLCTITNEAHNWDYFNNNNLCPPYPTCFLPEEFEDTNDNGYWDDGEPYTDANGNEHYDGNRIGNQDTTNCD